MKSAMAQLCLLALGLLLLATPVRADSGGVVSGRGPTRTPREPSPTRTATPTPAGCDADCDGDQRVEISELIGLVQARLAGRGIFCGDRSHRPSIDFLVRAVRSSLDDACRVAPPTRTPLPAGRIDIGGIVGRPGDEFDLEVGFVAIGEPVLFLGHMLNVSRLAAIGDCEAANPGSRIVSSERFPVGCEPLVDCRQAWIEIESDDGGFDNGPLYRCDARIAPQALQPCDELMRCERVEGYAAGDVRAAIECVAGMIRSSFAAGYMAECLVEVVNPPLRVGELALVRVTATRFAFIPAVRIGGDAGFFAGLDARYTPGTDVTFELTPLQAGSTVLSGGVSTEVSGGCGDPFPFYFVGGGCELEVVVEP